MAFGLQSAFAWCSIVIYMQLCSALFEELIAEAINCIYLHRRPDQLCNQTLKPTITANVWKIYNPLLNLNHLILKWPRVNPTSILKNKTKTGRTYTAFFLPCVCCRCNMQPVHTRLCRPLPCGPCTFSTEPFCRSVDPPASRRRSQIGHWH